MVETKRREIEMLVDAGTLHLSWLEASTLLRQVLVDAGLWERVTAEYERRCDAEDEGRVRFVAIDAVSDGEEL